jgi:hypothetical protein
MRDLLFDVPWYLPTVLGIIGLAIFVSGNRRVDRRLQNIGGIVTLVAAGWAIMSYLVDTPKEICQKETRHFVRSVVDRDWDTFDGLMEPGVVFRFVGSPWRIDGQDSLHNAVKADVEQIGLKSATATDVKASEADHIITVEMNVWSNQDYTMGTPIQSEWQLDWKESNGRWLLHEIRAIRVANVAPEQVRGNLRAH